MKGSFDPAGTDKHSKLLLFRLLIVVGFALGVVLLIQSVATYRYVSGALMMQEAERDSQRKVNPLVGAVRSAQTQDTAKRRTNSPAHFADSFSSLNMAAVSRRKYRSRIVGVIH